jgi:hypothetical protein
MYFGTACQKELIPYNILSLISWRAKGNCSKDKGKLHHRTHHEGPEGEWEYSSALSLASALDGVGGQRHAPAALPSAKGPSVPCTGGRVGPRDGLDGCGKCRPHWGSIAGPSRP